jgi:hypothetical protein
MLICAERGRLLLEWSAAVGRLSECIGHIQTSNLDQFEQQYKAAMQAREIAETAHTALVRHRKKHFC